MANTGTQCITEFLLMAFHRKALALFFPGIANHAPGKWRDCAAYATITASLLCRNCMVSHCKSTHQLLTACDLSLTPAPNTYQVVNLGSVDVAFKWHCFKQGSRMARLIHGQTWYKLTQCHNAVSCSFHRTSE